MFFEGLPGRVAGRLVKASEWPPLPCEVLARNSGGSMPARSPEENSMQEASLAVCPPDPARAKNPPRPVRRLKPPKEEIQELLSASLLATDKELGDIVREIDAISKALR